MNAMYKSEDGPPSMATNLGDLPTRLLEKFFANISKSPWRYACGVYSTVNQG